MKIRFENKVIQNLFGPSRIGKKCYEAYRGQGKPCKDCKMLEVLKDGKERRIIRDITLPDGGVLLVELNSAAIRDSEGNIVGAVEVSRDVTKQKKAEALLNKTLITQNTALRQLNNELTDAKGYIKTVLPQPISSGTIRTDWRFIPSVSLSGDSFGYHWIDEDHFAFYLLDVSGHGWAAALLSVSAINVIRSQALPEADFHRPAQVLQALNNTFPSEKHNDMFFTIWYGVYNPATRELSYSSGGHPPALLLSEPRPTHRPIRQLRTKNSIIGGERDLVFQEETIPISPPFRLYLFSDGVYEIIGRNGKIWGLNNFTKFCDDTFTVSRSNLTRLVDHTQEMSVGKEFEDDFTILEVIFEGIMQNHES